MSVSLNLTESGELLPLCGLLAPLLARARVYCFVMALFVTGEMGRGGGGAHGLVAFGAQLWYAAPSQ
jgi:hypothetical protein